MTSKRTGGGLVLDAFGPVPDFALAGAILALAGAVAYVARSRAPDVAA